MTAFDPLFPDLLPDSSMAERPAHNGLVSGSSPDPATTESFTDLCKRLEHFETPEWAAKAILKREILTRNVVDPCTGTGILAEIAKDAGCDVLAYDIHPWPAYRAKTRHMDFMKMPSGEWVNLHFKTPGDFTVFMNPPFSKAVDFVEKAMELKARKIVCFQRFAWWESKTRRDFWIQNPPARIYICGDRATSWRHDIPADQRNGSSQTAHAWFVWERGHPPGTLLGHIWREDAE